MKSVEKGGALALSEPILHIAPRPIDPAPDFWKLLTVAQKRDIFAREFEGRAKALEFELGTLNIMRDMMKKKQ